MSGIACPPASPRQDPAPTGPRRLAQRVRIRGLKPLNRGRGRVLEPDRTYPRTTPPSSVTLSLPSSPRLAVAVAGGARVP
jgi:hypothetical protein